MPARQRPRYLAQRGVNILTQVGRLAGRRPPSVHETFGHALAAHRPTAYPGRALVVLHERETALYTNDPTRDWQELAERVDIEVVPGADHAMLEEPGVNRLAALIHDRLAPGL